MTMRFLPLKFAILPATLTLLLIWTGCGGSASSVTPAAASLSASTVTFAGQTLGGSSSVTVLLTNTGGSTLNISDMALAGANSGDFAGSGTCGKTLAGGASCSLTLSFTPAATGLRTASLSISDSASDSPQTIAITGTGLNPGDTVDPLGAAAAISVSCSSADSGDQGEPNGTCYNVKVSCPGVDDEIAGVKVNDPTGAKGTVTYMVGGGGKPWYDTNFVFGVTAVDMVASAGFRTAQIDFYSKPTGFPGNGVFAGWLTGPGGTRALSCRFSTVSKWIYDNIRQPGTPFCHTGNSGGAAAPAYALAYHGFDAYYKFVELTSGPAFTRIDKGCICDPLNSHDVTCGPDGPEPPTPQAECYLADGTAFVDPSYNPTTHECTDSMSGDLTFQQKFYEDSIATPDAVYSFPHVKMNFVFGGQDTGSAKPQGYEWIDGGSTSPDGLFTSPPVTGLNGAAPTRACVADAPHPIPDVLDGAQQVANDLIANCQ